MSVIIILAKGLLISLAIVFAVIFSGAVLAIFILFRGLIREEQRTTCLEQQRRFS